MGVGGAGGKERSNLNLNTCASSLAVTINDIVENEVSEDSLCSSEVLQASGELSCHSGP